MWQGESSNTQAIIVGVPQRSILGPFLLTLYINNLLVILDQSILLYANDGTLLVVSKDIRTIKLKLTDEFAKIVNQMKLNTLTVQYTLAKPKFNSLTHSKTKHTNLTIKYENQILEQVSSAKLLEIHIDSNFTW